jgi:predicted nucleic acid-binding protein
MSEIIVFDTSIVVDQIRANLHFRRIAQLNALIRNSSVVLAELWRGAASDVDRKTIESMEHKYPLLTPTENNWLESGQILNRMQSIHGFQPAKLRDLHFDVLIALTARSHGARLITSNRGDFELIREYRDFKLEVW